MTVESGRVGWHVRLDGASLSPDPTYGQVAPTGDSVDYAMDVFPWEVMRCNPSQPAVAAWGQRLDGQHDPGALTLALSADGQVDLIVDFGTELEGRLEMQVDLKNRATLMCLFAEFPLEAEGGILGEHPSPREFVHFETAGLHTRTLAPRGFRYVRLRFHDIQDGVVIRSLKVIGQFCFRSRPGDFQCSDPQFQRAWQTSVYTARLCTRPDTFWDGIKRDRIGWFGDARIIKAAVDAVFHDPRPSRAMLTTLPLDQWANGVPVFSFDAIAMLHQHILAFGLDEDCLMDAFARVRVFLSWVAGTQLNEDGFIIRDPALIPRDLICTAQKCLWKGIFAAF